VSGGPVLDPISESLEVWTSKHFFKIVPSGFQKFQNSSRKYSSLTMLSVRSVGVVVEC